MYLCMYMPQFNKNEVFICAVQKLSKKKEETNTLLSKEFLSVDFTILSRTNSR